MNADPIAPSAKVANRQRSAWLWMAAHLRPYRRYIAQTMLIVFLIVVINFAVPLTARALVNSGMLAGDREFVYVMIAVQSLLYGSLIVLHYIRGQIAIHVANRLVLQMVAEYIHHVVRLPMAYFNRASNGDVVERIRDFERIQRFASVELMDVFTAAISLLSLGLLLLWIDPSLFAVFSATACGYLAWLLTFSRARRQVDAERFAEDARSRAVEIGIVQAIQDIKIAVQERHSLGEWENIQLLALRTRLRSATLEQRQSAGANLINRIGLIAITFLAAIGVMDGRMTMGDFTIAATISIQLYFQVDQILLFVNKYPETSGALRRAQEIRDTAAEPWEGAPALIPSIVHAPSITLRNVAFAYPGTDRLSLNDLSLRVSGGEMAALVGPSGSGKSTMLKLLLSLYQPVAGTILVDDLSLGALNRSAWRNRVGAVMQDGALFASTLCNNIVAGRELDTSWLDRVIEAAALEDVVSSAEGGMAIRIGPGGERLSAGQAQRILIARALYKKPALLLLDEATSALDGLNEATVVRGIRRLLPGTTMIVAAHRLGTIREADRIHVLREGRINEAGTHEALLRENGYYARMLSVGG